MKLKKLRHYILTTRPYSYVDIILVGIVAYITAVGGFAINIDLVYSILASFFWWVFILLIVETRKNKQIAFASYFMPLLPLCAIILLKNPLGLAFVILSPLLLYMYGLKSRYPPFGLISPLLRAMQTLLLFLLILAINNGLTSASVMENWHFIAAITLLVVGRNLMGDVRDANIDKFTIPARFGKNVAYLIVEVTILASIVLILELSVVFPFIVMALLVPILRNGYILHRLYLICSMFFLLDYSLFNSGATFSLILTNLTFLGVLLNFTYDSVPRTMRINGGGQ